MTATYNMAEWPADRQKRAREALEKIAPDMRGLVVEAMRRRASEQG